MNPRFLAAASIALASLTLSSASAATPTQIVYTGATIMQLGTDSLVRGYVEDEVSRLAGPAGSEIGLKFTLGSVSKTFKAAANNSVVSTTLKPNTIGEDQSLVVTFNGNATHAASSLTVPVDVWQYVLVDDTHAGGMLLINLERNELRLLAGSYDSGTLTGIQMTAAGPAIVLDVDATDTSGDQLLLKGAFSPDRGTFAVAGLAAEPFALART